MSFGRYSNYNYDSNKKNKYEFSNLNSNPFKGFDNMDIDMPSRNHNSFSTQYNSKSSNYQNFNFNNSIQKESLYSKFQNSSKYSNNNSAFSLEDKLNREQYHFPKNSDTHSFSVFNDKKEYNDSNFSTVKRIKFSNDTPNYNKHFNVQYPDTPTLPLKEFLWKNKELVENLMLKNFDTYISKKSEITNLLNKNINDFRKQFKSNDNIILNSFDKNEFLNSIKSFIFTDVKNNIKDKEKLYVSQNHNQYSTNPIPDYSTALYGASIIDSLTTETQPITSDNHMIDKLHIINNPPLLALENTLLPNSCWAMKGIYKLL
ncbi:hypothetical protein PIROE2DRAFT_64062 [Piromyces sp. E2]|nr:hypothetical protein PIROE2DRAFT_64062 [Piromyces sp. E2]|eukprot:OUM58992.1 hypothetical protein PIROE2DRAFT_64062 [Piromyces sp. E2]